MTAQTPEQVREADRVRKRLAVAQGRVKPRTPAQMAAQAQAARERWAWHQVKLEFDRLLQVRGIL